MEEEKKDEGFDALMKTETSAISWCEAVSYS
jgi:hypothetical protein